MAVGGIQQLLVATIVDPVAGQQLNLWQSGSLTSHVGLALDPCFVMTNRASSPCFLASQLSWRSISVLKASHAGPATQHSESSAATAPRPQLALMQQPPFCSLLTRLSCQMRLFYGCLVSDLSCMSVYWPFRMSAFAHCHLEQVLPLPCSLLLSLFKGKGVFHQQTSRRGKRRHRRHSGRWPKYMSHPAFYQC